MMQRPVHLIRRHLAVGAWLLVPALFAVTVQLNPGYSLNNLYVAIVLLGLWTPQARLAFQVAAFASVLVVLDAFLRQRIVPLPTLAFGRSITVLVLWMTAFVVTRYRRTEAAHLAGLLREEAAATALRRSVKALEDFKYAIDQSAIVAITDIKGAITYANDNFCHISQYSREELLGQNHRIINSGHHPVDFFTQVYRRIARGDVWRGEICNRAKDGSLYWVDTTIVPVLDETGKPAQYISIRHDITDRKRSEVRLRDQASLATLGKMAAMVAHEVRNPLAGIRGALQVIGERLPSDSTEHTVAKEIITRVDTLNEIVQDLLQFARPRQPVLTTVSVSSLAEETVTLLRTDPGLGTVIVEVDDGAVTVMADREMMKMVLLNLLINGAQAMSGTGRLAVTARTTADSHELRVMDDGPGIPADAREHVFEPFFSTKHRGTGLGLATARQIVEAHGGVIELNSPRAGGTVAVIRLPLRPAPHLAHA
jgi:two-component system CheB/CheR fusion protein